MRFAWHAAVFTVFSVLVLGFATSHPRAETAACAPGQVFLRGDWGQARFSVDLALSAEERARGLMFVEKMPASRGMLFVYPRPGPASFWMKNTLIPLDMIFLDTTGTVRHVHHRAKPGDLTPIDGGDGILAVLEINGGLAKSLGIVPGSQMRHPAFAGGPAAWPC
ncbi:hypothetical protein SAMN05216196_101128 [Lutimaribacter pacificus]|uniref:DUF192 domain-containing protein n=1 Tax=Lutimaribacter pacificus TaxID=391948 RepID=A0A1H0AEJ0_9RHOB|nr:DUF192 domain-containing protein [Lutimaribacter pacificus]SDN31817.1 hypothetical protein SAMN05216196_101128 [Lutimaribacter pacificus]SHJ70384.1 hypothetical protein SAMN05444142_1011089 [Lutimaribacter pacificus]